MKVFVFLADGFEEIEALTVIDLLRRAEVDVNLVSIYDRLNIVGAHNVEITAESTIDNVVVDKEDYMIFPGGYPGSKYLSESDRLMEMAKRHNESEGRIAAICAAPAFILPKICDRRINLCSYPGFEDVLKEFEVHDERVVCDGNITTANGPSSAMPFALAIVEQIKGKLCRDEIAAQLLL